MRLLAFSYPMNRNKLLCVIGAFFSLLVCLEGKSEVKKLPVPTRETLPYVAKELGAAAYSENVDEDENYVRLSKRLPRKLTNGDSPQSDNDLEYREYQGVFGRPGIDFPTLASIPLTKFSCRNVKHSNSGYYADLETNCQVFHVCDNGRKISFLCPNGTIFRQSHLICDWWFRVECEKSLELYEESALQLAADQQVYKERAEAIAKVMQNTVNSTSEVTTVPQFTQFVGTAYSVNVSLATSLGEISSITPSQELASFPYFSSTTTTENPLWTENRHEQQILAETASFTGSNKYNVNNYFHNNYFPHTPTKQNGYYDGKQNEYSTISQVPTNTYVTESPHVTNNLYNMDLDTQKYDDVYHLNKEISTQTLAYYTNTNTDKLVNQDTYAPLPPDVIVTSLLSNKTDGTIKASVSEVILTAKPHIQSETDSEQTVPSLLTQMTKSGYDHLFFTPKVSQNSSDSSSSNKITESFTTSPVVRNTDNDLEGEYSLGLVQSGSNGKEELITKLKLKSSPDLRELAQVFSRALSAYLEDPEQFRRILSEVRPTEPPTKNPISLKEEELLAFSEDRRQNIGSTGTPPRTKSTQSLSTSYTTVPTSSTKYSSVNNPLIFANEINNFMNSVNVGSYYYADSIESNENNVETATSSVPEFQTYHFSEIKHESTSSPFKNLNMQLSHNHVNIATTDILNPTTTGGPFYADVYNDVTTPFYNTNFKNKYNTYANYSVTDFTTHKATSNTNVYNDNNQNTFVPMYGQNQKEFLSTKFQNGVTHHNNVKPSHANTVSATTVVNELYSTLPYNGRRPALYNTKEQMSEAFTDRHYYSFENQGLSTDDGMRGTTPTESYTDYYNTHQPKYEASSNTYSTQFINKKSDHTTVNYGTNFLRKVDAEVTRDAITGYTTLHNANLQDLNYGSNTISDEAQDVAGQVTTTVLYNDANVIKESRDQYATDHQSIFSNTESEPIITTSILDDATKISHNVRVYTKNNTVYPTTENTLDAYNTEEEHLLTADAQSFVSKDNLLKYYSKDFNTEKTKSYNTFLPTISPTENIGITVTKAGTERRKYADSRQGTVTPMYEANIAVNTMLPVLTTYEPVSDGFIYTNKPSHSLNFKNNRIQEHTDPTDQHSISHTVFTNTSPASTIAPKFGERIRNEQDKEEAVKEFMDIMKEAENNNTLRNTLVLLLVSDKSRQNKTVREMKTQLLKALLKPKRNEYNKNQVVSGNDHNSYNSENQPSNKNQFKSRRGGQQKVLDNNNYVNEERDQYLRNKVMNDVYNRGYSINRNKHNVSRTRNVGDNRLSYVNENGDQYEDTSNKDNSRNDHGSNVNNKNKHDATNEKLRDNSSNIRRYYHKDSSAQPTSNQHIEYTKNRNQHNANQVDTVVEQSTQENIRRNYVLEKNYRTQSVEDNTNYNVRNNRNFSGGPITNSDATKYINKFVSHSRDSNNTNYSTIRSIGSTYYIGSNSSGGINNHDNGGTNKSGHNSIVYKGQNDELVKNESAELSEILRGSETQHARYPVKVGSDFGARTRKKVSRVRVVHRIKHNRNITNSSLPMPLSSESSENGEFSPKHVIHRKSMETQEASVPSVLKLVATTESSKLEEADNRAINLLRSLYSLATDWG